MTRALRPARSTDAGKLGAMIGAAVAAHTWKPQLHSGAEDIAHAANLIERGWVTVCEVGGEVAGFIARDGADVQSLFVGTAHQGCGIGTALLEHAKRSHPHLSLWTFEANTGAQRFYLRHGFSEAKRTDGAGNDEGLPDIRYEWHRAGISGHDGQETV